jgi:hypothetical protein
LSFSFFSQNANTHHHQTFVAARKINVVIAKEKKKVAHQFYRCFQLLHLMTNKSQKASQFWLPQLFQQSDFKKKSVKWKTV